MTKLERENVEAYVKDHIAEWLEPSQPSPTERRLDLIERIVRVEEAIKNQNLLMEKRFEMMEKRFEMMEMRFEAIDKRFEDLIHQIDKRFEAVDKRFEDMNKRFDAIARRFNWTIGITTALITGLGVLITIYRFLGPVGAG